MKMLFKSRWIRAWSPLIFPVCFLACRHAYDNRKHAVAPPHQIISKPATQTTNLPAGLDRSKILPQEVLQRYVRNAPAIVPNTANGVPFNKLDYDRIIAYDFRGDEKIYDHAIDTQGVFVPVITAQAALTQAQADRILSLLTGTGAYGAGTAACFNPHFALVFFKGVKVVNRISICLGCNYLISDIDIPAQTYLKLNPGRKDEYALMGFSEKGKRGIKRLGKELGFTYGK